MRVDYVKVDVDSPEVVELAKVVKASRKEIAGMINQDRYRKAYNKQKNEAMKVLRRLVKEHPELLEEVK